MKSARQGCCSAHGMLFYLSLMMAATSYNAEFWVYQAGFEKLTRRSILYKFGICNPEILIIA